MKNNVLKVNDLCIGQGFTVDVECNGMQCVILEDLGVISVHHAETPNDTFETHVYSVEWANDEISDIPYYNLKKIEEDGESVTDMLERVKHKEEETC